MSFHNRPFVYNMHMKIRISLFFASLICFFLLSLTAFADTTIFSGGMGRANFNSNGSQVLFTTDQTGYLFNCDDNNLYYQKTTNGGSSWAGQVQFNDAAINGDCQVNAIWYDQWTPSGSGDLVHIIAADDTTDNDLIYIEFDTSDDSYSVAGNISDAAGMAAGNYQTWNNNIAITKATDGDLYAAVADDTSHYVLTCTGTCTTASNWAETSGASPFEGDDDHIQLMPLASGDILMIQHDLSADVIESKVWNETSWSGFTTVESSVEDLSTAINEFGNVPLTATLNPHDNTIYIAYIDYDTGADFGSGDDDDIKTAKYSGGSWSTTTDASTNNADGVAPYGLSMAFDSGNEEVYLAYSGPDNTVSGTHSDTTTNYYYKKSSDDMSTWSSQSAAISGTDRPDWRSRLVGLNLISNERLYLIWFYDHGASDEYLYGDTIADLTPPPPGAVPEFSFYTYILALGVCLFLFIKKREAFNFIVNCFR